MKVLGMTFAREGSKRLPGKNMKIMCGKPLLEWSLIQLVNTKYVADYCLVTDSEEMGKLGEQYGFKIAWQPKEEIERAEAEGRLGGTYATRRGIDFMQELQKKKMETNRGEQLFDVMVNLLPTQPLRKPDEIDNCIELWLQHQEDIVNSAIWYKDMLLYEIKNGIAYPSVFDYEGKYWEYSNIWVGSPK